MARLKAAEATAAGVKYVERLGGNSGEKIRGMLEEVRDIDQRIGIGVLRLGRWVKVLGVVWAIMLTSGGLMLQQHLATQERERQRLAAEVRAAEDKARVEALLKAEAKERQLRKAERQLRKEERWVRVECRSQVQERDEISVKKVPTGEVDRVEVTEQETYWEEEVRPVRTILADSGNGLFVLRVHEFLRS